MLKRDVRIRSSEGREFDCYLVMPEMHRPVPAIVLASAIHGVDDDLRGIADAFGSRGYIAAAPDLFWRTIPGPLARCDARSVQRAQPRLEKIKRGEQDLADVLLALANEPLFNGRAAVIGFCYGGPYAVIGPKRLGYDAGLACHGTGMLDVIEELEALCRPVCLLWGDQDDTAPAQVLDAYCRMQARRPNLAVHLFPGVQHGYMMPSSTAFDTKARDSSMERALAILDCLRTTEPGQN